MEFIKLFNDDEIKNFKWKKNIKFEDKIKYKNSLVENAIKYPLTESINDDKVQQIWKNILELNSISIDNINDVITKYDLITKALINSKNLTGYTFFGKKLACVYNDKLFVTVISDNNKLYLNSTFLKSDELELVPLFYIFNYNIYNLFSVNNQGPIMFFDETLKENINIITNKKSFKDSILKYAEKNDNVIKKIINSFYNNDNEELELDKLLNIYEEKLDNIVKSRSLYQKEIDNEIEKINEIKNNKIKKITLMQKLEYLQIEYKKIESISNTDELEKQLKKFLKNNKEIFEKCIDNNYKKYIDDLINDEYMELYISPNEHKENLEIMYTNMQQDIITTYLISIYYYLIMLIIKKSDNTLTSKYEGNLIKKAIFNIDELEDFINFINKNLLI